ncbi:MAG: hypothetical protein U0793_03415 [Gemmataceae bacterium]
MTIRNDGKAAVRSVGYKRQVNIPAASGTSAKQEMSSGFWAQTKCCPRGAFLGLVEAGRIKGVLAVRCLRDGNLNKGYAVEAADLLGKDPTLARLSPRQLFKRITSKAYNGQTDVVLALYHAGLLITETHAE